MYGNRRITYRASVERPERNRSLWKPMRRVEDNNKMDLQEIGLGDIGWVDLAQDRGRCSALVNAVKKILVP
jgi:hypothetical protein